MLAHPLADWEFSTQETPAGRNRIEDPAINACSGVVADHVVAAREDRHVRLAGMSRDTKGRSEAIRYIAEQTTIDELIGPASRVLLVDNERGVPGSRNGRESLIKGVVDNGLGAAVGGWRKQCGAIRAQNVP